MAAESAGWIESRLWSHLPAGDREFLLDVGLFDWVDGDLLDEALERDGSIRRLKGMACRAGLLEPVRSRGARIYRLHPLIRDHCPTYRRRATSERYRSVQRLCASAARRDGVRHAPRPRTVHGLVARILTDAGGLRLWPHQGVDRLVEADRHLTEDAIVLHPRLALVRSAAFALTDRLAEARQRLEHEPQPSNRPCARCRQLVPARAAGPPGRLPARPPPDGLR